ncbi:MAG: choice-of-anchor D domain-containing protein, partial [Fimbriimonadaceae bacterium]
MAVQADGRIVIAGQFTQVGGVARNRIARLNANGTLDAAFNSNANSIVFCTALQPDGKALFGGVFLAVGGVTRNFVARSDGDPATQSLVASSANRVEWLRGGTSPETQGVTFDLSIDGGTTWASLGAGTRIIGGWEMTGLSLPASGHIRSRASTGGGRRSGSFGFIQTVSPFPLAPEIAIEQPLSVGIEDGGSRSLGVANVGANSSLTFTIRNTGNADLSGLGVTIDGPDAGMFSITANPAATVSGPMGSTTFTVQFAPTSVGTKTAVLHIASNDSDEGVFDITVTGSDPIPEIAIQQPVGTDIPDGGTKSMTVALGNTTSLVFTIQSVGTDNITGLTISKDGTNASEFTVTSAPVAPVAPNGSTTFTVVFNPTAGGTRTAALHITNNDADESPFDITLAGQSLTFALDTDNDGMSDAAEFQLATLGFNWQVLQTTLVNTYFANANGNSLYTTSQIQALNVGIPLLQRNPTTGVFTLTIGVEKSANLSTFAPFPMSAPQTLINGQGKLEFQFTVPDNAAFFQLKAQ